MRRRSLVALGRPGASCVKSPLRLHTCCGQLVECRVQLGYLCSRSARVRGCWSRLGEGTVRGWNEARSEAALNRTRAYCPSHTGHLSNAEYGWAFLCCWYLSVVRHLIIQRLQVPLRGVGLSLCLRSLPARAKRCHVATPVRYGRPRRAFEDRQKRAIRGKCRMTGSTDRMSRSRVRNSTRRHPFAAANSSTSSSSLSAVSSHCVELISAPLTADSYSDLPETSNSCSNWPVAGVLFVAAGWLCTDEQ